MHPDAAIAVAALATAALALWASRPSSRHGGGGAFYYGAVPPPTTTRSSPPPPLDLHRFSEVSAPDVEGARRSYAAVFAAFPDTARMFARRHEALERLGALRLALPNDLRAERALVAATQRADDAMRDAIDASRNKGLPRAAWTGGGAHPGPLHDWYWRRAAAPRAADDVVW